MTNTRWRTDRIWTDCIELSGNEEVDLTHNSTIQQYCFAHLFQTWNTLYLPQNAMRNQLEVMLFTSWEHQLKRVWEKKLFRYEKMNNFKYFILWFQREILIGPLNVQRIDNLLWQMDRTITKVFLPFLNSKIISEKVNKPMLSKIRRDLLPCLRSFGR